jgi:gas vesicle protein
MLLQNKGTAFFAGVVLGGLVGASLALLLAPQPGQETRAKMRNKGYELKDLVVKRCQEASHQAQEQVAVWQEKGQHRMVEAFNQGKEQVIEAMSHGKDRLMRTRSLSQETVASKAGQPV